MYHYNFKIVVLSTELSLYEKVDAMPSLEGFTNMVQHKNEADSCLCEADFIM